MISFLIHKILKSIHIKQLKNHQISSFAYYKLVPAPGPVRAVSSCSCVLLQAVCASRCMPCQWYLLPQEMLHMTEGGRDKQQSWFCCAATSLLLEIRATSLNTLHSDLATHVAERAKRTSCDTSKLQRRDRVKLNSLLQNPILTVSTL